MAAVTDVMPWALLVVAMASVPLADTAECLTGGVCSSKTYCAVGGTCYCCQSSPALLNVTGASGVVSSCSCTEGRSGLSCSGGVQIGGINCGLDPNAPTTTTAASRTTTAASRYGGSAPTVLSYSALIYAMAAFVTVFLNA